MLWDRLQSAIASCPCFQCQRGCVTLLFIRLGPLVLLMSGRVPLFPRVTGWYARPRLVSRSRIMLVLKAARFMLLVLLVLLRCLILCLRISKMSKVFLPPGCAGFADGNDKYLAVKGPGSYVNLDPTDPKDARALKKLKNQDYAVAGLVDAGPEKQFVRDTRKQGRWCRNCNFLGHAWMRECSKCHGVTVAEADMVLPPPPRGIHGEIII